MNFLFRSNNSLIPRSELVQNYLWMILFNGLIASVISFITVSSFITYQFDLASLFIVLQQIGHFQFFAFIVLLPILLINLILPYKRFFYILGGILLSLFLIIVLIDYAIFQLYKFHINGMVWNLLTGGAMHEIFVFDTSNIMTLLLFICVVFFVQFILFKLSDLLSQQNNHSGRWVFVVIFSIQLSGQFIHAYASAHHNTHIMALTRFVPLAQPLAMNDFLYDQGWAVKIDSNVIKTQASGRFKHPTQPLQCDQIATPPNIIFIVMDGLRFDMLNRETMPNWHQLSQTGQVFTQHMSTGNATRFGIFGLFTGLYGNYWFDALNNTSPSLLMSQLVKHDYQFGFFSNARLTSPEFDRAVFSQVKDFIPEKTEGNSVIERELKINEQAKTFFKQQNNNPFFSLIFYDAPHAYTYQTQDAKFQPTQNSINYLELNNESDTEPFLNRYKNSIVFDDRLTGELLDTLKENNLLDNSIIVLTGDHGQEANETKTNSWGHNSNFSKQQIQVPLLIHWPNKEPKTYQHLTSHVDVVPTLLKEVFNCQNPVKDYSNGQLLFNETERPFVLSNNWNNQALINKDFIREFHKIRGPVNRNFADYSILADEDGSFEQYDLEVLRSNSRFYQ